MGKFDGVLIASDMDRTLLNSKREISRETLQALQYFESQGGRFTVATGRSLLAASLFFDALPINAPAIIFDGSAVYDVQKKEVLHCSFLTPDFPDLAREIMGQFPHIGVEVFRLDSTYLCQYSDISKWHFEVIRAPLRLTPLEDIEPPIVKSVLTAPAEEIPEIRQQLTAQFGNRFQFVRSEPTFLDVTLPGIHKGAGLKRVAEQYKIPLRHVYAAGDDFNDVEMLKTVGQNAFAPENACEEVKAVTKNILPDLDHHPIAALVEILDGKYKTA